MADRIISKFKTEWTHKPVALTRSQQARLDKELEYLSDDLDFSSDLIFHTVLLGTDRNGPVIIIDSDISIEDTLFLTYYEIPNWVYIDD